jgi:NAD+ kinase
VPGEGAVQASLTAKGRASGRYRCGIVVRPDPERYQRRSGVKLSLLDLPFLPEEMRAVLPGGDPVALTLDA